MTRIIWRRAHPVRLPDKDTPVHRELLEARVADLCLKEVAQALEAMKPEQPAQEAR
ncbi:hypothetical protein [Mesorhizobium sp. WSM4303]|uniref:hypothetical protein n=1 Tax=Mesorhizobium sp. WSM4303 TaxID=2589887 RepID=UPI00163D9B70|nr:hypothetical protein [Mesorhizobium sp. WSM4303]